MQKLITYTLATLIVLGSTTPAFAHGGHGGGGFYSTPAGAKVKAAKDAAACKANADKCVGFGTHYYGK